MILYTHWFDHVFSSIKKRYRPHRYGTQCCRIVAHGRFDKIHIIFIATGLRNNVFYSQYVSLNKETFFPWWVAQSVKWQELPESGKRAWQKLFRILNEGLEKSSAFDLLQTSTILEGSSWGLTRIYFWTNGLLLSFWRINVIILYPVHSVQKRGFLLSLLQNYDVSVWYLEKQILVTRWVRQYIAIVSCCTMATTNIRRAQSNMNWPDTQSTQARTVRSLRCKWYTVCPRIAGTLPRSEALRPIIVITGTHRLLSHCSGFHINPIHECIRP